MADFRHWRVLILSLFCVFFASCSPFTSKKPPMVLILLESYSEQDFLCSDPRRLETLPHLQSACEDMVRFTHVYAPSNLTQTSLSTLMTGLTVAEHGVQHNGALAISGRLLTLAEQALANNMRTLFASGGVPLLKKFGIGQGYEEFDEPFEKKENPLVRPLADSVNRALRWLDDEVKHDSFFMTLYAPDLMFSHLVTQDGVDVERPQDRNSSIQELHETIDDLIDGLKKRKKWKNTNFVVLGLNGPQNSIRPINPLSGQYFHVPLQVKVSEKVKSNLLELRTEMVSFARLGQWLHKLMVHKPSQGDLLFSPEHEDRFIAQQNSWESWLGLSNWVTYGLRKKQYLFVFDPNLKVYESFFDKKEFEPILKEEAVGLSKKFEIAKKANSFFPKVCFPDYAASACPKLVRDQDRLNQLDQLLRWSDTEFNNEQPIDDFGQKISTALRQDQQVIIRWLAYQALVHKRWTQLFELGQKTKNQSWMLLSQMNLRENPSFPVESCLRYFVEESKGVEDFYKYCQDSGLRRVVEGLNLLRSRKRPSDSFWSQVHQIRSRRGALHLNLHMLYINDLNEPFDFAPSLSELYFYLPENRDFLSLIQLKKS